MSIELFRIDDRLIHGQVVVGWGQPLDIAFIVLVDDQVAANDWEQDLYRMGVPAEMDLFFETVESAILRLADFLAEERPGILLTGDVLTMRRLSEGSGRVEHVNVGGVHHRPGRVEHLRYVFLTDDEAADLRALADGGVEVSARDLPSADPVSLDTLLAGRSPS
jgi:mannose/fructose/N-acetylgalactosamine-specific phosphotransferase system component IIB